VHKHNVKTLALRACVLRLLLLLLLLLRLKRQVQGIHAVFVNRIDAGLVQPSAEVAATE
jgi:hypothetical protein